MAFPGPRRKWCFLKWNGFSKVTWAGENGRDFQNRNGPGKKVVSIKRYEENEIFEKYQGHLSKFQNT